MGRFGEYLLNNIDREWHDFYINYDELKDLIDNIISFRPNAEKIFCKKLDKEWIKYYNFINNTISAICDKDLTSDDVLELLRINTFVHLNREGFRKIIKKHDKNSNYKLYPAWKWKIRYNPTFKLYPALKKISELQKDPIEDTIESQINNKSFKRESVKFWVSKENIVPVICNILPNLPIHLWDEDINEHIYQMTSSVYLDNSKLECYNDRIDKLENSKLIRIRWYGEDMENVFVERKVHHDSWVLIDSSKDRFQIHSRNILAYLRGDLSIDKPLENEIQNTVYEMQLYPKIRTVYKRIAFQLKHTNKLRISLDVNLKLIREKTNHLEWFTEEDNLLDDDIYRFPYAILEIKLSDEYSETPPIWVSDLMNSSLVIPQYKFSKYIHSIYHYFGNKCNKIPHWIDEHKDKFNLSWENTSSIVLDMESNSNSSLTNRVTPNQDNRKCFNFKCFKNNDRRISNAIKIEPKTFFSNERTYLQWFNAAVFVASGGLTIMSLSESKTVGTLLVLVSILIIMYSTFIYYKRNDALINRKPEGYNDIYGPILLSIIMIISFIISVIYQE